MIDMISAIEELSGLTTRELSEMLKESESFVLQSKADDGGPKQVDMEKLVSSLPLHLLAVCLDLERGSDLTYVLRGMRFLHSLSELATRHTRLEQILLDDVKLSEQVMDLIFFVLSILSHWKKENHLGTSPFIHTSLLATSLHLLTSYFSSQWHELVHILLAHPKVDIFMDVAFDSLHEDMRILSFRLSTYDTKAFSAGPFDSQLTHFICQQCEASLQFLLLLCQQKLFRDRILKNKELCRDGGILSLSLTILKLGVPEYLKGSMDIASSISRLKAKILFILLQLCEAESISYLDEVATLQKSMQLGQTLALEVLDLLKTAFGRKQKPIASSHDKSYPMGSVLISALRLVDVFSDDSNFRSSFITNTIPFLTQILATPHDDFVSSWCSVNLPVMEDDANLDYDPFGAAELALVAASNMLTEAKANYSCPFRSISMPSVAYAQTRTACVVKIIANLHVFVPNICEEQERDLFLQKFQKYLLLESPRPSLDHPASNEATTVCRNLGSLSQYAKSLILNNLLNEEDVQLLSEFSSKLYLWCKSQVGQRTLQVAKSDTSSQMKEDLQPVQQLPTRANVLQNIEDSTATPSKQEGNARDETPRNRASVNGGLLQNSVGQNLIHLGVAKTSSAGYPGASSAISMEVTRCKSADHFETPEPTKESGLRDDDDDEGQNLIHGVAKITSGGYLSIRAAALMEVTRCKSADHLKTPEPTKESGLRDDDEGQNLIHGVARITSAGYLSASAATSMEVTRCKSAEHLKTPEPTKESGLQDDDEGQNLIHGVPRITSGGYLSIRSATSMEVTRCKSADHLKTPDPTKESGFRDDDERQPKRKKRTIMNDGQVSEIENALVDEPEMHKSATSLQAWAEKLSGQGSEITSSQLKNWLNNRKAKLARIAKERGGPYDGESADKPSTAGTSHFGDSSESAGEESCLPSSRVLNALGISKGNSLVTPDTDDDESFAEAGIKFKQNIRVSLPSTRSFAFKPGHPVVLIDNEGNGVGKGEVFQVVGRAQGKSLIESGICIVDVTELKIEKWRELPHPSEASGRTFQEAESMHGGVMRVAWDIIRLDPVIVL